jgi:hypothetical protein
MPSGYSFVECSLASILSLGTKQETLVSLSFSEILAQVLWVLGGADKLEHLSGFCKLGGFYSSLLVAV